MKPLAGRHAASLDGDFVVFIIGMHINRPLQIRRWWPAFAAMRPMVAELRADRSRGLLHASFGLIEGGPVVLQYWSSFEDLEAYARSAEALHLPAWRRFNQRARGNLAVGVYHETYRVSAGRYEAIYVNMPPIGLGRAGGLAGIGSTSTAAVRLGDRPEDPAPVAGW
jgi:hypothetical protein